ncbi:MAG TPA: ABC transporter permease [Candidatus Acidoferrum sp.]|nr:ABC transporter permease [Candidatus Acidoferrum sp.]
MELLTYFLRRLALTIMVLFTLLLMTFILTHAISSNPLVAWLGRSASLHPELAALYAEKYHLNDPIYVQFGYYVWGVINGNLGFSAVRGQLVSAAIIQTLPNTLQIVFFAILISLGLGLPLGILSARYSGRYADNTIRAFYLAGISSPAFFTAILLMLAFSFFLHLLPTGGLISPDIIRPRAITNFPLIDAILSGDTTAASDELAHLLMPSLALALTVFGFLVRVLRNSMLEVMQTNYVRTARAKGLTENDVFVKHALKNSLMPVVTLIGLMVTWLVTSSLFVETVFSYPGMGQLVVQALSALDYPIILGATIVFALIIFTANFCADIVYAVINPEIRLGG